MKKCFTLIELMIVIAIVALLASIAAPALVGCQPTNYGLDSGIVLRDIQYELREFGYYNGPLSDTLDEQTAAAITKYRIGKGKYPKGVYIIENQNIAQTANYESSDIGRY